MNFPKRDLIPPLALRFKDWIVREFLHDGSTGLDCLDLRLIDVIQPSKGGFFVELGANDGIRQSNTYKLQKHYGWTGLLIEPSPRRYVQCLQNRSFGIIPFVRCAACVPSGYSDRFVEIEDSDLMSVAKGLNISDEQAIDHADSGIQYLVDSSHRYSYGALAMTLTSLLDDISAPFAFDLLSLDVEGNELSVLHGFDFSRYSAKWILVETRSDDVDHYLNSHGYKLVKVLSDRGVYIDKLFSLSIP